MTRNDQTAHVYWANDAHWYLFVGATPLGPFGSSPEARQHARKLGVFHFTEDDGGTRDAPNVTWGGEESVTR